MSTASVSCPKCGSTQITAQKRGFSGGKAVAGAVLTGGVGLLAGLHGSSNIDITCLACGKQWNPKKSTEQKQRQQSMEAAKSLEDYRKWKAKFYYLVEQGRTEEAADLYRGRFPSHIEQDPIANYEKLKSNEKEDQKFRAILVAVLLLVLVLIIWAVA
jgi:ribosomal protein S27E